MADIIWPDDPDFWLEGQEDNLEFDVEISVKRNGGIETLALPGARWRGALTFPADSTAYIQRRRKQEAFIASLKGGANRLLLWNLRTPEPLGTMRGTVVQLTAAASAGATSVAIANGRAHPNMLRDSGFEFDTNADGLANGWASYTAGTTGTVTNSRTTGLGSNWSQRVQATGLGSSSSDRIGILNAGLVVTPLAPYTFSCDMIGDAGLQYGLEIVWKTAGGVVLSNSLGSGAYPTSWARQVFTATAPATAERADIYAFGAQKSGGPAAASVQFDNIQFEPGSSSLGYAGYPTLLRGDRISLGGQRVKVTADLQADDAGAGTVQFEPPLRQALSSGAAVTLTKPTSRFVLTSPLVPSIARGTELPGFTIEYVEAP